MPADLPPSSIQPPPAAPAGGAVVDLARGLVEGQLRALGRLAEAGLQIALAVERQATGAPAEAGEAAGPAAAPAPAVVPDVGLAYARVARAVRLTVALQAKLLKDLKALEDEHARQASRERSLAEDRRGELEEARKDSVHRIVGRIAWAGLGEAAEEDAFESLMGRVSDRLEHDDIYDVLDAPVSETIARICRDLGLDPDWEGLADEAWARAEAASGAVGAPLAALFGRAASPAAPPGRPPGAGPPGPAPHAASP